MADLVSFSGVAGALTGAPSVPSEHSHGARAPSSHAVGRIEANV